MLSRNKIYLTLGIILVIFASSFIYYINSSKSKPECSTETPPRNQTESSENSKTAMNSKSESSANIRRAETISTKKYESVYAKASQEVLAPSANPEDSVNVSSPFAEIKDKYPIFKDGEIGYRVLLHDKSIARIAKYKNELQDNINLAGKRLRSLLNRNAKPIQSLSTKEFLNILLATKKPLVFAESEGFSPNNSWSTSDAQVLGEASVVMPVKIFDNGHWTQPKIHQVPLDGYLMFTPGALLVKNCNVDYPEVVKNNVFSEEDYYNLYERRLLPSLKFASEEAGAKGSKAVITFPGIGCGQFAGSFRNILSSEFDKVIKRILSTHSASLSNISLVYYSEHSSSDQQVFTHQYASTKYLRIRGSSNVSLLENPATFNSFFANDDFSTHILFAFVAWDHLSLPGNDFFRLSRFTDDGVKAAATSSMTSLLGIQGHYDENEYKYLPDTTGSTWESLADGKSLEFIE